MGGPRREYKLPENEIAVSEKIRKYGISSWKTGNWKVNFSGVI